MILQSEAVDYGSYQNLFRKKSPSCNRIESGGWRGRVKTIMIEILFNVD